MGVGGEIELGTTESPSLSFAGHRRDRSSPWSCAAGVLSSPTMFVRPFESDLDGRPTYFDGAGRYQLRFSASRTICLRAMERYGVRDHPLSRWCY